MTVSDAGSRAATHRGSHRAAAMCDDRRLLGFGKGRGVRGLRPGLQFLNRRPLSQFRHLLRINPELSAQRQERSFRSLYYCSDGVRGHGAPMTYLSHTDTFYSNERIALSNRGITTANGSNSRLTVANAPIMTGLRGSQSHSVRAPTPQQWRGTLTAQYRPVLSSAGPQHE